MHHLRIATQKEALVLASLCLQLKTGVGDRVFNFVSSSFAVSLFLYNLKSITIFISENNERQGTFTIYVNQYVHFCRLIKI